MLSDLSFRPATPPDASGLAVLFDAASRRLMSWVWSLDARPGQSFFEVGRIQILTNSADGNHLANWHVALLDQQVAGGLCCFPIADPPEPADPTTVHPVILPFVELSGVAKGSLYISVASVFPEHRGKGVGSAMLHKALALARAARASALSLIVESFNPDARRLYERHGFRERARRRFIPFPGCLDEGELILMIMDVPA